MGRSADELMEMKEREDGSFEEAFDAANCRKMVFRCRAKMDSYGDQPRYAFFSLLFFNNGC
jgi:replication factor A1